MKNPIDIQAVTILYTEHTIYGWGWHVQFTKHGKTRQEFHPTFEGVSRLIEGWVLT